MDSIVLNENDEIIIKLLHYFVTEENYSPIVLRGAKNEIWLEKLDGDYKIVRLVSNYIHNNEQLNVDLYRTSQIMKRIKRKTMSFSINALSIFINLGDNVDIDKIKTENIDLVNIKSLDELNNYAFVTDEFPTITKKNPIITKILIFINLVMFLLSFILGDNLMVGLFANYGPAVEAGQIYRLFTSIFLHISFFHFLFNMYALYIIGPQIENFFGKWRYLIIYLGSGLVGNLLSIAFNLGTFSLGASGAIFGLLGSLIYFGYHYRVYLDSVIKSQIIPLIFLNLCIGFMFTGIDNAAHIGGLIGGVLFSWTVGVKYKSTKNDIITGIGMTVIFIAFLCFLAFMR